jgi:hypothetical protein
MTFKSIAQMVDNSLHFPMQKPSQILKPYVPRGSNILCTELVQQKSPIHRLLSMIKHLKKDYIIFFTGIGLLTNFHFFSSFVVSKQSFLGPFFISHLSLSSTHLLFHQLHSGQCSSWLCAINGSQISL